MDLSRNTLWAWYLDVKFLVELIEKYELDVDDISENIEFNFWKGFKADINYFIYEALTQIASKFIEENSELFETESNEYEIYTNFLDSHIYFTSEIVQSEFERFY